MWQLRTKQTIDGVDNGIGGLSLYSHAKNNLARRWNCEPSSKAWIDSMVLVNDGTRKFVRVDESQWRLRLRIGVRHRLKCAPSSPTSDSIPFSIMSLLSHMSAKYR